jgi:hypothetical protein
MNYRAWLKFTEILVEAGARNRMTRAAGQRGAGGLKHWEPLRHAKIGVPTIGGSVANMMGKPLE